MLGCTTTSVFIETQSVRELPIYSRISWVGVGLQTWLTTLL